MKGNVQFACPQSAVRNVVRCPSVWVFHLADNSNNTGSIKVTFETTTGAKVFLELIFFATAMHLWLYDWYWFPYIYSSETISQLTYFIYQPQEIPAALSYTSASRWLTSKRNQTLEYVTWANISLYMIYSSLIRVYSAHLFVKLAIRVILGVFLFAQYVKTALFRSSEGLFNWGRVRNDQNVKIKLNCQSTCYAKGSPHRGSYL